MIYFIYRKGWEGYIYNIYDTVVSWKAGKLELDISWKAGRNELESWIGEDKTKRAKG